MSAREFIEQQIEARGPWACPDCWPEVRVMQTTESPPRIVLETKHGVGCTAVAQYLCDPIPDLFPDGGTPR